MAALTWRQVAAPDLSDSLRGYDQFSRTLNTALGGLRETVEGIDEKNIDRNSQGLMLEALQAQDPEAIRALAARAGTNPGRINAQAIAMLGARPGQILGEQNAQRVLDEGKYGFGKEMATDAISNLAIQAKALGRTDPAAARALLETNGPALAAAGFDTAAKVSKMIDDAEEFGVDIAGKRQEQVLNLNRDNRDQGRFNREGVRFSWEKDDRDVEQAANILAPEIFDRGLDAEGIRGLIMQQNPRVRGALLRQASQFGYGNVFQPGDVGLSSGSTGSSDFNFGIPQQSVAKELKGSGLSDNVIAGFLGNFHIEGGYTGAKGDGGSAAGIAQWRGERQDNFRRVIGKTPTEASPAEQARFVKWELDNPERAGMTKAQADAIKNARSPQEAAALIDKHYERSNGKSTGDRVSAAMAAASSFQRSDPVTAVAAISGSQIRSKQDQNDPVFQIYNQGLDKAGVPAITVAQGLANGALKGIMTSDEIEKEIIKGVDESGGRLNATQVAGLVVKNNRPNDSWNPWASKRVVNEEAMSGDIQKILKANPTDRAQVIETRKVLAAQAAEAQQAASQATAAMNRVIAARESGRPIDPSVLARVVANAQYANRVSRSIQQQLSGLNNAPERTTDDKKLPISAANPRNRFTGAPVRSGSLVSQIWEDLWK